MVTGNIMSMVTENMIMVTENISMVTENISMVTENISMVTENISINEPCHENLSSGFPTRSDTFYGKKQGETELETSSPKGNDAHLRVIIQSEKKWKHQFFRRLRAANSVVRGRI